MKLNLKQGNNYLTLSDVKVISWSPLKVINCDKIIDLTGWEIHTIVHPVNKCHKRRKTKWQENLK